MNKTADFYCEAFDWDGGDCETEEEEEVWGINITDCNMVVLLPENLEVTIEGEIDEVRFWDDKRTASEIADNMFIELNGDEAGLVAYYKMSNGTGTTLTDNSSNSYNGTLNNMDNDDWAKFFYFERNVDKENDLYYNVLGLTDDSEFVFISNLYNTDIRDSKFISPEQFDLPVVELQILDGFTLFDLCKVLEKAKKIHTVNTSINYIIDVLDTSCDEYIIYAHDESNKFKEGDEVKIIECAPISKKKSWEVVNG